MLVCRKSTSGNEKLLQSTPESARNSARRKLGEGGPIFFPRRKPSAFAEAMLAQADRVTAYDDAWFAGRPSI